MSLVTLGDSRSVCRMYGEFECGQKGHLGNNAAVIALASLPVCPFLQSYRWQTGRVQHRWARPQKRPLVARRRIWPRAAGMMPINGFFTDFDQQKLHFQARPRCFALPCLTSEEN